MTDHGKSIRTRLLNLAKKENLSFQLVIIRYMRERLLYRIAVVSVCLFLQNLIRSNSVSGWM